jgi:hypothetical protein
MWVNNQHLDYFEQPPAFFEIDLHDFEEILSEIRQELFLIGDKSYMNYQKIMQMIVDRGSSDLLNELIVSREMTAPF